MPSEVSVLVGGGPPPRQCAAKGWYRLGPPYPIMAVIHNFCILIAHRSMFFNVVARLYFILSFYLQSWFYPVVESCFNCLCFYIVNS